MDNQQEPDKAAKALKMAHEAALQFSKQDADGNMEMFKSVLASGQAAIKSVMMINGGAAVAILAFMGHLATNAQSKQFVAHFGSALLCFAAGVLLAALATGTTYLAQYTGRRNQRVGTGFNCASIALTIVAAAGFAWGCFLSYQQFSQFK